VQISPARSEDLETILEIESVSFEHPWRRQAVIDELSCTDACPYIARVPVPLGFPQDAAGFILVRFIMDDMHIMKLAVAPRWRKRGVATALLGAAQQEAHRRGSASILLEVRPSNVAAVRFYRKAGFRIIGKRPNYYPQSGEDALVMSKRLKEEP
jgi:ribosomal-protein-alanine N-acetyltransferase